MRPPLDPKSTLTLSSGNFPRNASLQQNVPEWLKKREQIGLCGNIRQARKGEPIYFSPEEPPNANDALQEGRALNKALNDLVVKSKTVAGVALRRWTKLNGSCPNRY